MIYISAPFSGQYNLEDDGWFARLVRKVQTWHNIYNVVLKARELTKKDLFPLMPHVLTVGIGHLQPYDFWLENTIEVMRRCDAVWFVGKYETSFGCRREYVIASVLELPIYLGDEDFNRLVDEQTALKNEADFETKEGYEVN